MLLGVCSHDFWEYVVMNSLINISANSVGSAMFIFIHSHSVSMKDFSFKPSTPVFL